MTDLSTSHRNIELFSTPTRRRLAAPVLLVCDLNDPNEPELIGEALRAHGRREELLLFDDDGHEIDKARGLCGAAQSLECVAHPSIYRLV